MPFLWLARHCCPGRNWLEELDGFAETEEKAWGEVHLPLALCQHYQLPVSDELSCLVVCLYPIFVRI